MGKITPEKSASPFQPGELRFGQGKEHRGDASRFTLVFRCRKSGFDYMGQVKLQKEPVSLKVELFNENFFHHFAAERNHILSSLESEILRRLAGSRKLPEGFKELIRSLGGAKTDAQEVRTLDPCERNGNGFDLQEIFDRLNAEYFSGGIQAEVMWGRDSKTRNRSTFRFGSYDRGKKLIRIHPRLDQDFVPLAVVELTVYHEMCHQWVPSIRHNGIWRDHHADFKKKEREYGFYREARSWEKQNWQKLLKPVKNPGSEK